MCDEHTIKDEQDQQSNLTRREFNTLAAGTSVAFSFPALANPLKTVSQDVDIPTADGVCDALFVHPAEGTHPAVLIWPDILALRPSFRAMATRLAESLDKLIEAEGPAEVRGLHLTQRRAHVLAEAQAQQRAVLAVGVDVHAVARRLGLERRVHARLLGEHAG